MYTCTCNKNRNCIRRLKSASAKNFEMLLNACGRPLNVSCAISWNVKESNLTELEILLNWDDKQT